MNIDLLDKELSKLFQDNLGNRITVALANGMLAEIIKTVEKLETKTIPQINKAPE